MSLGDALNTMPQPAVDDLIKEVSSNKVIALSGKMSPPTGWDFVIVFERADILHIIRKMLTPRALILLLFGGGRVAVEAPPERCNKVAVANDNDS
ncbi:MAG: hypothetical protein D9V47_00755 [Clostridia bacterium]|nr:MAG: hypothetical protein D9V47_00755 [Clostridia bacterium]